MPNSSALQLADLALTWDNTVGTADLSLIDLDLASDRGLETAVALSLFTDRRAQPDDVPPSGDPQDRRGWWADQFADIDGDLIGSRLWLLDRSKLTNETVLRATQYVKEGLQWMLDDDVISGVDVLVTRTDSGIQISGQLFRPGKDPVSFRFVHVWDHLQEDA
jgi:phage gp46-like protein